MKKQFGKKMLTVMVIGAFLIMGLSAWPRRCKS